MVKSNRVSKVGLFSSGSYSVEQHNRQYEGTMRDNTGEWPRY